MPDSAEVVGDELVVVHNQETVRLSLAVPLEGLDLWLEFTTDMPWRDLHNATRDKVMPASAREQIVAMEEVDSVHALAVVRRWVLALNERLGKALSSSLYGGESEQPSQPTSGSGTDSTPTGSASTAAPKPRSRTRKQSSAT